MDYQDYINQSKQEVYEKAVATKILDLMDKLRLSSNKNNKKRWIWELLQNAKDVKSIERKKVDAIVELKTDEKVLIFKHNGKCFSTKNITFLIEQVSSKERSPQNLEETTGKFGTGFLTTHLLSEIVEVKGVVRDDNLPYRKFSINLDRSSTEIAGIIEGLNKSLKQLEQVVQAENYENYDENEFNTSFTYSLNEDGFQTAVTGIQDLETNLPLTLVFLPTISSVKIQNQDSTYLISSNQELSIDNTDLALRICKVKKDNIREPMTYEFVVLKGSSCEVAIPVTQQNSSIYIVDSQKDIVPRIFCDFPLVGSESFGIPFFINSPYFHPTEPRDGIFLTDIDNEKIKLNKKIITTAVSQYLQLIDYASSQDWKDLYQLAMISIPSGTEWLSIDWYTSNLLQPIQEKIYTTPLVRTEDGSKIALKYGSALVDIPFDKREEVREAMWDLVVGVNYFKPPAKAEIHQWYEIFKDKIWDRQHCLTISRLTKYITQHNSRLEDLATSTFQIEQPIDWLNQYFSVLQLADEQPLAFLQKENHKVIPNQYGDFCLPSDLQSDPGIESILKDIGKNLFKDYYKILCHTSISISKLLPSKSQQSVVQEINAALKSGQISQDKKRTACHTLTSLFPPHDSTETNKRDLIYEISKKLFAQETFEKQFLENWTPEIWEVSDRMQATFIVEEISQFKNLHALGKHLSENIEIIRDWLSSFARLVVRLGWKSLLEETTPILPNQNGTFCDWNSLFVEGDKIDECLKDISSALRRDFRDELIDNKFDVQIPRSRTRFQKDVAREIRDLVTPRLAELPRKKETQDIFNELILWMDSNPDVAKDIFGDLFDNRHKLYDDAEVARNLRQVRILEERVAALSQENQSLQAENDALKAELEELRARVSEQQANEPISENETTINKDEINDDFLITFGVTTEQQLRDILNDPKIFSRRYVYFVQSSYDPFARLRYVLEIIQRAKQNVKRYLESREDYDCSGWTESSITYISGVLKQGKPIRIIVRPSDNKRIIFYYPEEIEVLAKTNSELWVEDGKTPPQQITLGMVLWFQGINFIQLP